MKDRFPHFKQKGGFDCGPTCLKIICHFHKMKVSVDSLVEICNTRNSGLTLHEMTKESKNLGLKSFAFKTDFLGLYYIKEPFIVHWNKFHYLIVYKIDNKKVYISDPANGKCTLSIDKFITGWHQNNKKGIVLLLEPLLVQKY